jgi:acyl carrier protein
MNMDKQEFINQLKQIVTPYTEDPEALENIDENTDFIKDLKINSANLVDIVLDLEERYGIEIDNDSMSRMLDVRSTMAIIEEKLGSGDR